MKKWTLPAASCLLTFPLLTFAATTAPQSGFFAGLGGSYDSINMEQKLYASGVSNVYDGSIAGPLVAYGEAGGPASPFSNTQSTMAPDIQFGYFKHFINSSWLWGATFSYKYLGTTATNDAVDVPQYGSFVNVSGDPSTSFTGNVVVGSSQMTVNHEFTFIPFIGHDFQSGYFYFGAGPAVFETQSNLNGVTGYADINGAHTNITGTQANFSSSSWMVGGAAEVGAAYYFDPTWFVDANYTFVMTGWRHNYYSAPFSNTESSGGTTYIDTGTLYANTTERVISQALSITLNKVF